MVTARILPGPLSLLAPDTVYAVIVSVRSDMRGMRSISICRDRSPWYMSNVTIVLARTLPKTTACAAFRKFGVAELWPAVMIPDEFVVGMATLPIVPEVLDGVVPLAPLSTPKLTDVALAAVVPLPLWVLDEATDPDDAVPLTIDEVDWAPLELDTPNVVAAVMAVAEARAAVSDEDDDAAAAAAADVVLVVPAVAAPVAELSKESRKSVM